jgi:hypothetical protein
MPHALPEGCHHDRAPLLRLGKVASAKAGRTVYVLLCTECGFTVTTDQIRKSRRGAGDPSHAAAVASDPGFYANLTG